MKTVVAGGGTGGHVFPGIALAQELVRRDPDAEVVFVGTARGMEVQAVPQAGFALELLDVGPLRGRTWKQWFENVLKLPQALWAAVKKMRALNPDVAVSVGGYAAGPAVLACALLGVPCVVMEQNAVPGLTNRVLGFFAKCVLASVPVKGFRASKTRVIGNPVRSGVLAVRAQAYEPHNPLRLLVMGGSQGAHALNVLMMEYATHRGMLHTPWHVLHQTGKKEYEEVRDAYARLNAEGMEATPFIDNMAEAYAQADVVLCRAGASTLAELTLCGRASVLVPFPHAAGDHQTHNARMMEEQGAALHVPQADMTAGWLIETLNRFAEHPETLQQMAAQARALGKPQALEDAANVVTALARGEVF